MPTDGKEIAWSKGRDPASTIIIFKKKKKLPGRELCQHKPTKTSLGALCTIDNMLVVVYYLYNQKGIEI